ncbi:MAG: hypothetical protein QOD93_1511 [Acetobacteraceae bacterium]|jgi:hypothetical protein|nr:hypothetical protein [Rhodopila sp.]MEA2768549.1 hypothetical protein [Acetobacteraceae bacterium]
MGTTHVQYCVITGLGPVTHDFPLVKQRHGWPNKARPRHE